MTMPWGAKKKIAFLCVHESLLYKLPQNLYSIQSKTHK